MDFKSTLSRLFGLTKEESESGIEMVGDEMTGDTGFLSYRRRLSIRHGDKTIRVFLKFSDRGRQDMGELQEFSNSFCPRECLFYGCLAPLLQRTADQFSMGCIGLPLVHLESVTSSGTLLVMEDLCDAGFQLAPPLMNVAEVRCVLDSLARVQAAFWLTRSRLGGAADGLFGGASPLRDIRISMPGFGATLDDFLASGFATFRKEFSKYLQCEKRVAIINAYLDDGFLQKAKSVMEENRAEKEIVGVTHSDMWYNNFMLKRGPGDEPTECRLLDWQFFEIGSLLFDLGPLWVSSVDNAIAVESFLPCVEFYVDTIRELVESRSHAAFPVSADVARQQAIRSLNWGMAWVVMSAETLWAFKSVTNVLSNMADVIEHFSL